MKNTDKKNREAIQSELGNIKIQFIQEGDSIGYTKNPCDLEGSLIFYFNVDDILVEYKASKN